MQLRNWLDGYAVISGTKENIMNFITTELIDLENPFSQVALGPGHKVNPILSGDTITFPSYEVSGDLRVISSEYPVYIGFDKEHDVIKTPIPDFYYISTLWDQLYYLHTDDVVKLAKEYQLIFT